MVLLFVGDGWSVSSLSVLGSGYQGIAALELALGRDQGSVLRS